MHIDNEIKLDYSDVLIRPKRSRLSSRAEVRITREFKFPHSPQTWNGIPIMAANMDTTGTIEMANALSQMQTITCLHKYMTKEELSRLSTKDNVALSCGLDNPSRNCLDGGFSDGFKFICLDVANGYSERFIDLVKDTREKWKHAIIIAGNVVTAEMTEALILAGADIVKVGIGPGSVCTTRKITGVGYPQLSAVIECSDAAHGLGGHIAADGGCTCPGDVAKAFAAGADFVMLGGMLAGAEESGAEKSIDSSGVVKKKFYGMSSKEAMDRYAGGVASYRAAEGKCVEIPYTGPVQDTLNEILGGVRSACTYVGAKSIKDLPKCTTFVRVNRQLNNVFGV
jgi:GMP reductase